MTDATAKQDSPAENMPSNADAGRPAKAIDVSQLGAGRSRELTEMTGVTVGSPRCDDPYVITESVDVYYDDIHALRNVTLEIGRKQVIALIGPSGCGKTSYLRCLNRMNDSVEGARVTGRVTLGGEDVYSRKMDPVTLRARVGMVFQKPNPFPKSIYDNVAYGPRIHGLATDRAELDHIVFTSLERAGLLQEVRDLSLIHISEPTRQLMSSRIPSSA